MPRAIRGPTRGVEGNPRAGYVGLCPIVSLRKPEQPMSNGCGPRPGEAWSMRRRATSSRSMTSSRPTVWTSLLHYVRGRMEDVENVGMFPGEPVHFTIPTPPEPAELDTGSSASRPVTSEGRMPGPHSAGGTSAADAGGRLGGGCRAGWSFGAGVSVPGGAPCWWAGGHAGVCGPGRRLPARLRGPWQFDSHLLRRARRDSHRRGCVAGLVTGRMSIRQFTDQVVTRKVHQLVV